MANTDTNTYEQVYNVREDETLLSRVALVVCVLAERGLFVAGFSITKELLTIHYAGYSRNKPVWELDFFEHLFANEPLLLVREKVKGLFVSSHKNIIVPDELYAERDAVQWMQRIFYIEEQEAIVKYPLINDKATYLHSIPLNMSELIRINFKKAVIQPLAAYQFGVRQAQSLQLQCCISNDQVTATLHNYSQLLWHRIFDYSGAEDIAYAIKLLCRENYIDAAKLNITCNALSGAEYDVINELTQYFPGIKGGNGHTIHDRWDPSVMLANQLLGCVL
jgi:hypothetical protein